ncbi:hypothetical protein Daus18300_009622 [Diaporthe australafricana]|uniref:Uncharacterized protein n=1 Tax=Diaporthe australafricana TaxID=127596 RepID=A0ABR3WDD8_9PEZI
MGTNSLKKKPSLVGRLRQFRSAALAPSKTTFITEKRPVYVPIQSVDQQPATRYRDDRPRKPVSNPLSYYPERGLDLNELDSKLEQYAKRSVESTETETDAESDGPPGREMPRRAQRMNDQASTADTASDGEPERDPSSCLEPVTSLQPPSHEVGSVESCLDPPQTPPEGSKPSDYEVFMQEAEETERQRKENKDLPPKPNREPPPNPFYSNNWDHQSRPSKKLAEIQEAADGDPTASDEALASTTGDRDSDRLATSSEESSEKEAANAGPPKSTISRATTGGERHIKFSSNTCAARERGERRASAPSCATRVKSPVRPVRKQKSIRQLIADYIRPPRG